MESRELPKLLRKYRDQIYKNAWDKYKAELDMQDLAQIFRVVLPTFYRVVSKKKKK